MNGRQVNHFRGDTIMKTWERGCFRRPIIGAFSTGVVAVVAFMLSVGVDAAPPVVGARDKGQVKSASRLVTSPVNQIAREINEDGGVASGALMELKWLPPQGSAAAPYPTCSSGGGTTGVGTADLTIPGAGPNGQTLWLGMFISGWGAQEDLFVFEGQLDSGSLSAGLSVLRLPCPGDDDQLCIDQLGRGSGDEGDAKSGCNIPLISNDTCSPAFSDTSRGDSISNPPSGDGLTPACNIHTDDLKCGAISFGLRLTDPGGVFYTATFVLSAAQSLVGGPHTVQLFPPNGSTYMNYGQITLKTASATLSIETGSCCFGSVPGQLSCEESVSCIDCESRAAASILRSVNLCPGNGGPDCCGCAFKVPPPGCVDSVVGVTDDNLCTENLCAVYCLCHYPGIAGWNRADDCCDPVDASFTTIDDGDPCTYDSCTLDALGAGLGVDQHVFSSSGTPCDDGNACTYDDKCNAAAGGCAGSDINSIGCNDHATCDALVTGTLCHDGACYCLHSLGSTPNPFGIPGGSDMNRTGGFAMPASAVAGGEGEEVVIRVKLRRLYIDKDEDPVNGCPVGPDFSPFENQVRYLGPPSAFDDNDTVSTPQFVAAKLQCTPFYRDWSPTALTADFGAGVDASTIYYYGAEVVPCSVYEAQQASQACIVEFASEDCFSTAFEIRTALWGDVWPPFGVVSFTDIGKIVDAFKSIPFVPGDPPTGAPRKVQAMLRENSAPLDSTISFTDIGNDVDAFKTIAYSEVGPTDCL